MRGKWREFGWMVFFNILTTQFLHAFLVWAGVGFGLRMAACAALGIYMGWNWSDWYGRWTSRGSVRTRP